MAEGLDQGRGVVFCAGRGCIKNQESAICQRLNSQPCANQRRWMSPLPDGRVASDPMSAASRQRLVCATMASPRANLSSYNALCLGHRVPGFWVLQTTAVMQRREIAPSRMSDDKLPESWGPVSHASQPRHRTA